MLLFLAGVCWPAASADGGRLQVTVVDRTRPEHPLSRQRVRLTIVERGASSDREALTDGSGRVAFTGLPLGGIRVFLATTEFRGVAYRSDRVVLTPERPAQEIDLRVYESSSDRAAVRGGVALAVADLAPGAVRVNVVQDLENTSDRSVAFSAQNPLAFPLPAGAGDVTPIAGWRDPHVGAAEITDAVPLTPGTTRVAYAYTMRVNAAAALSWRLPYGAGEVDILLPAGRARLEASGLTARGVIPTPHGRFARWSGGPVSPGGTLVIRIGGLPSSRDIAPAAVAAALGLALTAGLALAARRPGALRSGLVDDPAAGSAGSGGGRPRFVEEQAPVPEARRTE